MQAVFPHTALVGPPEAIAGETGANLVIVASRTPLNRDAIRARLDVQAAEPVEMLTGAELAAFVDGAQVLTDDYAPVDQLLGG